MLTTKLGRGGYMLLNNSFRGHVRIMAGGHAQNAHTRRRTNQVAVFNHMGSTAVTTTATAGAPTHQALDARHWARMQAAYEAAVWSVRRGIPGSAPAIRHGELAVLHCAPERDVPSLTGLLRPQI